MTALDPRTWDSLFVIPRRNLADPDADVAEMHVCIVGATHGVDDENQWPVITTLRGYQPMRYAQAVITAAVQAKYEVGVWRQLTGRLGMDERSAALPMLADLRKQRPAISDVGTRPLVFTPVFGWTTKKAYVVASYNGIDFAQWPAETAMLHARHVIEAAAAAPMDSIYFRYLRDTIGLDEVPASAVVYGLRADLDLVEVGLPEPDETPEPPADAVAPADDTAQA